MTPPVSDLKTTPLHDLHLELGARMVPFAGYSMPVQYPTGLVAEHRHTRTAAGLFDVSHMGQLRLSGPKAAQAFETLVPADVIGLGVGRQRYGLLLQQDGGILDDLMFFREAEDSIHVIVNGACKAEDIAHIQKHIGKLCQVEPLPDRGLLALQGPEAARVLGRLAPGIERLVFMTGGTFAVAGVDCLVTRSGYTGEDGFEISVSSAQTQSVARALLAEPEVAPIGLGARNSLRLEAGLCLYGNDIDAQTTPGEAGLNWAIQKVRRNEGTRGGGFMGSDVVLSQIDKPAELRRMRVGLIATERVPVREPAVLQNAEGQTVGHVTSGLLSPTLGQPIAMGYVDPDCAAIDTPLFAVVRGKPIPMRVSEMPFCPSHYFRG